MVKKAKLNSSSATKETYLGLRLLFVILWLIFILLLINSDLLHNLLEQSNTDNSNLIINVILLAPIAIIVFPLAYRLDDTYSIGEKRVSISTWKCSTLGIVVTGIILVSVYYLFMIISVAFFY
jgi:hypothetical protein